ncbi:MAG: accessory Sec system translocase SecA2 [Vicinamibacterales bacterium]
MFAAKPSAEPTVDDVNRFRAQYFELGEEDLKTASREATSLPEVIAVTAVVAARVLGLHMFDVQLRGALALAAGRIAEMQTGEGKTLAAVPAVVWYARSGDGVHVLTANDYLARRDADWMRGIYAWFDLSVGVIQQGLEPPVRHAAYRCDVTYATANEVGFDYLRDQLALSPDEQVHRTFATAVVDEADSILIDEARIPLVIAGGAADAPGPAAWADRVVRTLAGGLHFTVEPPGRNVSLTPAGVEHVERALNRWNLFESENFPLLTAVQHALHAHVLLRKDVDYVVQDEGVVSVDEFKGRTVQERRWPAGLQTALELKESVTPRRQGRVLGSITIQNLIALYPTVCGMTGTAATQAEEFREIYELEVDTIPTNRPVVRVDEPDSVFPTKAEKEAAVIGEISRLHATGRPVLVGTASVEESERLSRALNLMSEYSASAAVPHHVLNARNEDAEAAIIAQAGTRGAVTISTNMAGRGVDIQLGPGVAELGGLHVIGTNRHESRRIDNQLRGRAGRQGDPGSSRFFVSYQDPLMMKYGADDPRVAHTPDSIQRAAEGQNLDIRLFLRRYESVLEGQRLALKQRRQDVLTGAQPCDSDTKRLVTLTTIDELWSEYLAAVAELRAGTVWISLAGGNPLGDFLRRLHAMFEELQRTIDEEIAARLSSGGPIAPDWRERGATWTYLTTDEPFGTMTERAMRGLVRMVQKTVRG